jgi:succinate dehydrogenase/fumarate reductase flavoprotein subunit
VTGGVHGENRLGGNSLMDVLVFGRIAGKNAALYAKEKAQDGRFTLNHVRRFHKELEEEGIDRKRISPILLPDYSNPLVRGRQLTTIYEGTVR